MSMRYGGLGIPAHLCLEPIAYEYMQDMANRTLTQIFDPDNCKSNDRPPLLQRQRASEFYQTEFEKVIGTLTREQQNVVIDSGSKSGRNWIITSIRLSDMKLLIRSLAAAPHSTITKEPAVKNTSFRTELRISNSASYKGGLSEDDLTIISPTASAKTALKDLDGLKDQERYKMELSFYKREKVNKYAGKTDTPFVPSVMMAGGLRITCERFSRSGEARYRSLIC
ncbi:hypothetical protein E3P92_03713 [Wallemia ichthyophaga]|nr:hypothetical protein E3P91_03764 [Wallemia ichthyophaga]TIB08630.1 hypothetical protein E3P92_03713 [Wallemia ichthyophaga]TIB59031.1 hypothetical protein E3P78_03708 [Wallemia ichthyophaga]